MKKPITTRMPTWVAVIIAMILIGAMVGTSYKFYITYRTPPNLTHAGAVAPSMEPGGAQGTTEPEPQATVETEQLRALRGLAVANPDHYRVGPGLIRFRSSSGNEVCAYANDVASLQGDRWVVLAPVGDEPDLKGPGIACSMVRGPNLPAAEDRRECAQKTLAGRAATLTTSFVGYGACLDGYNPATEDARLEQNVRMSEVKELPNGSSLTLGDRFVCGALIPEFTCVDTRTGRGFGVGPAQYDLFPAQ